MDWKLIASTFMLVLFAEFGDKTQLAAISLAATMRQPFAIAAGAIGGLAVGTIFAVAVGLVLRHLLPAVWIRRGAGLHFPSTGLLMLFGTV